MYIPHDLLKTILLFLPPSWSDVVRAMLVCKSWQKILRESVHSITQFPGIVPPVWVSPAYSEQVLAKFPLTSLSISGEYWEHLHPELVTPTPFEQFRLAIKSLTALNSLTLKNVYLDKLDFKVCHVTLASE